MSGVAGGVSPGLCLGCMPEHSMCPDKWPLLLMLCLFLTSVLTVPAFVSPEQHSPTLIIPTKYRLMMMDMIEEAEAAAVVVPTPTTSIAPLSPGSTAMAVEKDTDPDERSALVAGLVPDSSYSGLGRGFVQTNFDVNFAMQGMEIDNHEILSARGLFDVHVAHSFN